MEDFIFRLRKFDTLVGSVAPDRGYGSILGYFRGTGIFLDNFDQWLLFRMFYKRDLKIQIMRSERGDCNADYECFDIIQK